MCQCQTGQKRLKILFTFRNITCFHHPNQVLRVHGRKCLHVGMFFRNVGSGFIGINIAQRTQLSGFYIEVSDKLNNLVFCFFVISPFH